MTEDEWAELRKRIDGWIKWRESGDKVTAMLGPDHPTCRHEHYDFEKHGRRCTCGTWMADFGD